MSYAHKGSRLMLSGGVVAIPFNTTHLDFNFDTSGISYGKLVEPNTNPIYTMRPFEGKFGGAIAVDESTTNLMSNPFFDNNINGWSNQEAIVSFNNGYNPIKDGNGYLSVVCNTGNTGNEFVSYSSLTNFASGGTYTVSAYVEGVDGFDVEGVITVGGTVFYTSGNDDYTWTPQNHTYTKINYGDIYKIEKTFTLDTSRTFSSYQPRIGELPNTKSIKVYAMQIEQKSFSTSIVNGTRTIGIAEYPVNIVGDFSISFHYKSNVPSGYASDRTIVGLTNGTNYINFFNGYGTDWYLGDETNRTRFRVADYSVPSTDFQHIVLVRQGTVIKVYRDGVFSDSKDFGVNPYFTSVSVGGSYGLESNYPNGLFSDLVIYDNAISDDDVMQIYLSEQPIYNPYDGRAWAL